MTALLAASKPLSQMSINDRVDLAKSLMSQIQDNWTRLAEVVWSLRQDGYDTEDLCIPLCGFLEKAAAGAMLIEAIQLWYYNEPLLRRIARLPIIDQQELLDKRAVAIIEFPDRNSHRMIPLDIIEIEQIKIAFDAVHGRIRSIPEQAAILNNAAIAAKRRKERRIIYDPNGDTIDTDGPKSRPELLAWLKKNGLYK